MCGSSDMCGPCPCGSGVVVVVRLVWEEGERQAKTTKLGKRRQQLAFSGSILRALAACGSWLAGSWHTHTHGWHFVP